MAAAKNKFNDSDYNGVLRIYHLYQEHKDNANLNFRMGECYLQLKESDDAIKYFKDSKSRFNRKRSVGLLYGTVLPEKMESKAILVGGIYGSTKMKRTTELMDRCF